MPEQDRNMTATADGAAGVGPPERVGYVGDYELLGEIGRGGMGVVYRARQISLGRVVALKMLLAGEFASPVHLARFHAETAACARLDHPNIVPVYEVGSHNGMPYFSMRYVESAGRSLTPLPPDATRAQQRELAALVAKLARAVQHAHERGVIHRDIKPANVLIDSAGEPHLSDFGLAKSADSGDHTSSGAVLGTPAYMSPEQAVGDNKAVSVRTDVYGLGGVLYFALTGRPPFESGSVPALLRHVCESEPARPRSHNGRVEPDLEAVCLRCLEREPGRRYTSAGELADELERFAAGEPVRARPPRLARQAQRWATHYLGATVWVVALGVLLGLASVPAAGTSISQLMTNANRVYADYPEVAVPWWVAWDWQPVAVGAWLLTPAGYALDFVLGPFLVVVLTRPRDLTTAALVGLGVGVVAAGTMFLASFGPAVGLAEIVVKSLDDTQLIQAGYPTRAGPPADKPHPQDALIARYPSLAAVPEDERAERLRRKIVADQVVGMFRLFGYGVSLVVALSLASALAAVVAARLRQTIGDWRLVIVPYMIVTSWLGTNAVLALLTLDHNLDWGLLSFAVTLPLGLAALVLRWGWRLILAVWPVLGLVGMLAGSNGHSLGVVVTAGAIWAGLIVFGHLGRTQNWSPKEYFWYVPFFLWLRLTAIPEFPMSGASLTLCNSTLAACLAAIVIQQRRLPSGQFDAQEAPTLPHGVALSTAPTKVPPPE